MSLQDEIVQTLIQMGTELKKDLWQPDDIKILNARAKDFVGLDAKARASTDPVEIAEYRGAADLALHHVRLMAIIRLEQLTKDVLAMVEKFFVERVIPALAKLLPALFGTG